MVHAFAGSIWVSCSLWALLVVWCLEDSGPDSGGLVRISYLQWARGIRLPGQDVVT